MEKKQTNRQLRAAETRQRILKAAKELITKNGFENVAIEDIAKRAGVSTGSFYTYFKRKEDIVDEINRRNFYHLAEIVNEMTDRDVFERLAYYCREFLKEIELVGIEICRQWIRNNIAPTNMRLPDAETTKYNYDYRAVGEILAEAKKRGELKKDAPADKLALYINAELYGLMVAWCMSDGKVVGSEEIEGLFQNVLNAALAPYLK